MIRFGILAEAGGDIPFPQTELPFSYPCGTVRSMQRWASPVCVFIVEPDAGPSAAMFSVSRKRYEVPKSYLLESSEQRPKFGLNPLLEARDSGSPDHRKHNGPG